MSSVPDSMKQDEASQPCLSGILLLLLTLRQYQQGTQHYNSLQDGMGQILSYRQIIR